MKGLGVEAFIWEGWNYLFYLGGFNPPGGVGWITGRGGLDEKLGEFNPPGNASTVKSLGLAWAWKGGHY